MTPQQQRHEEVWRTYSHAFEVNPLLEAYCEQAMLKIKLEAWRSMPPTFASAAGRDLGEVRA